VRLAFCRVTGWKGEPRGMENQRLEWVDPAHPETVGELLPATLPPLRWLQLPNTYGISNIGSPAGLPVFLDRLGHALDQGLRLVQLREPGWPDGLAAPTLHDALQQVLRRCRAAGARAVVNSVHPQAWWRKADGVHLRACDAAQLQHRPLTQSDYLVGVSVHDVEQMQQARKLEADFAVVGPVAETTSHPGQTRLGWKTFVDINRDAGLPSYAIGGQSADTMTAAREYGAHGIAAIRGVFGA
jgi:8-oxo-dGTP diphosphatase